MTSLLYSNDRRQVSYQHESDETSKANCQVFDQCRAMPEPFSQCSKSHFWILGSYEINTSSTLRSLAMMYQIYITLLMQLLTCLAALVLAVLLSFRSCRTNQVPGGFRCLLGPIFSSIFSIATCKRISHYVVSTPQNNGQDSSFLQHAQETHSVYTHTPLLSVTACL